MDPNDDSAQHIDDEQLAFEQAFASNGSVSEELPQGSATEADLDGAADPAKAGSEAAKDDGKAQETPAADAALDPFAGLPEEVRNRLQLIPTLQRQLDETAQIARREAGRVAALQSRIDKMSAAVKAPEHVDRVKGLRDSGLPEIADAIDGMATALATEPLPEPAAAGSAPGADEDQEMRSLDLAIPGWDTELQSQEFRTWLSAQDQQTQRTVVSTSKAADIAGAISRFRIHRANRNPAANLNAQRQARMTAAVPTGTGATAPRAASPEDEEEAAFVAGFNA